MVKRSRSFKCGYCGQIFYLYYDAPEGFKFPSFTHKWSLQTDLLDTYIRLKRIQISMREGYLTLALILIVALFVWYAAAYPSLSVLWNLNKKSEVRLYSELNLSLYLFNENRLTFLTVKVRIRELNRTMVDYYGVETIRTLVNDAAQTKPISLIADRLRRLSKGDEELFVNYALQITMQLKYRSDLSRRTMVQHPLYTLYIGSGLCLDHSLLYASILKARGFDVAIVLARVNGSGIVGSHAMVAVKLSRPPGLPVKLHPWARSLYGYPLSANITINGETWYLAEPTSTTELFKLTRIAKLYPTLVGEHKWVEVEVEEIVIP